VSAAADILERLLASESAARTVLERAKNGISDMGTGATSIQVQE